MSNRGQSTHRSVWRHSSPLSYATVSRARAGTSSLRSSSAWAPHASVSHSTAACHKSSSGSALNNHHETALPLACIPTPTLSSDSLCLFSRTDIWISSEYVCEREGERGVLTMSGKAHSRSFSLSHIQNHHIMNRAFVCHAIHWVTFTAQPRAWSSGV